MSDDDASVWPEQEAVDAWTARHGIKLDWPVQLDLQDAVTVIRLGVQRERDKSQADLAAMTAERDAAREATNATSARNRTLARAYKRRGGKLSDALRERDALRAALYGIIGFAEEHVAENGGIDQCDYSDRLVLERARKALGAS